MNCSASLCASEGLLVGVKPMQVLGYLIKYQTTTVFVAYSTKCAFHTVKMWWRLGNEARYVCVPRLFPCSFSQTRCIGDPKGQLNLFAICHVLDCVSLSLSHADCVGVLIGQSALYLWGGQCDWQLRLRTSS